MQFYQLIFFSLFLLVEFTNLSKNFLANASKAEFSPNTSSGILQQPVAEIREVN